MKSKRLGHLSRALFSAVLMGVLIFGTIGQASAASLVVIYVNRNATGANNGTSWTNAYKSLQTALVHTTPGISTQIWVAKGTYRPSRATSLSDPRTKTFKLQNDVAIYGGFAGYETVLSQRNVSLNQTILSGDIGTVGDATDNVYHVVTASLTGGSAVLNGFMIRDGRADGAGDASFGAGVFISTGSPTLTNLTFRANVASVSGGAIYMVNGSPVITSDVFNSNHATYGGGIYGASTGAKISSVTFTSNSADVDGGGMYNAAGSFSTLTNVNFSANTAGNNGAGLYILSSSATLTHVIFSGNIAVANGGGMYGTDLSTTKLTNSTFNGNSAGNGGGLYILGSGPVLSRVTFRSNTASLNGGGVYNDGLTATPTLTNVTFSGNIAPGNSGGMYNHGNNPVITNATFGGNSGAMYNNNSDTKIYNSILYANGGTEILNASSNVTLVDSIVKDALTGVVDCLSDGSSCTGVLNSDPALGPLQNNGGLTQTRSLGAGSAAIDAGGVHWACASKDQRGIGRPQGAACDMGAYEVQVRTFVSQADYDGWVLEDEQGSGNGGTLDDADSTLQVGDDASNRQYRGFLSFNTATLPDTATILRATVKLKSAGGLWDPFSTLGTLQISLSNPYFGTDPELTVDDFQESPVVTTAGTIPSTLSGGFYTGLLGTTARANINRVGTTQLRLAFTVATDDDDEADYISLVSGDSSTTAYQPRLTVYYNPK